MSKLIFVLDGEVVNRDDLGDPNNYLYLVNGTWKGNDELTDEDINTLYYSELTEVHLRSGEVGDPSNGGID